MVWIKQRIWWSQLSSGKQLIWAILKKGCLLIICIICLKYRYLEMMIANENLSRWHKVLRAGYNKFNTTMAIIQISSFQNIRERILKAWRRKWKIWIRSTKLKILLPSNCLTKGQQEKNNFLIRELEGFKIIKVPISWWIWSKGKVLKILLTSQGICNQIWHLFRLDRIVKAIVKVVRMLKKC